MVKLITSDSGDVCVCVCARVRVWCARNTILSLYHLLIIFEVLMYKLLLIL